MMMARCRTAVLAVLLLVVLAPAAMAQDNATPRELLEDFIHYTRTANPELATGNAQALLDRGLTNAELAELLDEQGRSYVERFNEAVALALRSREYPGLRDIAGELSARIESGRLELARDPERIEKAISMLVGNLRGRRLAEQRLEAAGEYAVPKLLRKVIEGKDEVHRTRCRDMIVRIGREAVYPLSITLKDVDANNQRIICDMLGEIGYRHAAPYLREVAEDPGAANYVRDAAARAFRSVGGVEGDLSIQFSSLAKQYFGESLSLVAYPYEQTNNIWEYDAFSGLIPTPVPTDIFSEIRAMQTSLRALGHDSRNRDALALFVASNLRRENEMPAGASDAVFGDLQYTPDFYATVFGTDTSLNVLAMAIDAQDTQLVRDAIDALSETTGGSNLLTRRDDARNPLIESLNYPDRRVQYEAALTLGGALPPRGFTGDFAVVPILASAVRTGNQSFAVVIADSAEDVRINAELLENLGFEVIGSGRSVDELRPLIEQAVGVDLAVVRQDDPDAALRTVANLRNLAKTTVTPVLISAGGTDIPALTREFRANSKVRVAPARRGEQAMGAAIDNLLDAAAGGRITDIEAEEYAARALQTLRDIAISDTPAYNIADAQPSLLAALNERSGAARMLVADILALIESDKVQRTLFDAALQAEGSDQVELLNRVAESIKRFGDRAEKRQLDALTMIVQDSTGPTAEAAARVHGAMNLPSQQAMNFLPEQ